MTAWASASNFTRAVSELGLTAVEQQRMLRNNNLVTTSVMVEKDARAEEKADLDLKAADLKFKQVAAEASRAAAKIAAAAAVVSLIGSAVNTTRERGDRKKSSWGDIVNGVGNVITKILDINKAKNELEAVKEDMERLNIMRTGSDKAVQALAANPFI